MSLLNSLLSPIGNQGWEGTVDTYADLPPAAEHSGEVWAVTTSSGIWPFNHPAGLYISNGITWNPFAAFNFPSISGTAPITYDSNTGEISTSTATNRLIGRSTSGVGVMEQINLDPTTLSLSAGTLTVIAAAPSGAAGGDLSGTYPNPTVAKINGVALGSTAATSGNLLIGSGTDWITQSLTGDISITTTGVVTLTTVNSNVGSFGTASNVSTITVNAKGLITAASNTPISITSTAVTDFTEAAQDAVGVMVDSTLVYVDGTPLLTRAALTGDATAPQASNVLTLATVNSNVGSFGSATQAGTFTVNGKGLITAVSNTTITPAVGSITGLGIGVATALGVNIGSGGAPVLFNGAGGTPSSITLTNASGTAASLTAGTATLANTVSTVNEATDTTCFLLFVTASGTQSLQPKNNTSFTFDSSTGQVGSTSMLLGAGNKALSFGGASPAVASRKIELYRITDNDHQVYAFGVDSSTLRYQIPASGDRHVFYSGINSTTSLELMRISGTGIVNIPGTRQIANFFDLQLPQQVINKEEIKPKEIKEDKKDKK